MNDAMRMVVHAIYDTVCESPDGVPAGPMYAAVMNAGVGITLDQFTRIMDAMVQAGLVRHSGNQYFPVMHLPPDVRL